MLRIPEQQLAKVDRKMLAVLWKRLLSDNQLGSLHVTGKTYRGATPPGSMKKLENFDKGDRPFHVRHLCLSTVAFPGTFCSE